MTTQTNRSTPPARRRVGGAFFLIAAVIAICSGCEREPSQSAPVQAMQPTEKQVRFVVRPRGEKPLVSFTFPEPLNDYKGEAKEVSGELTIAESMSTATLRGFIEVLTASVTLGESGIDENAHSAMFMNVEKYPVSRFTITSVDAAEGASLLGAEKMGVTMHGGFTLKGITVLIRVPATLSLDSGDDGEPVRMKLEASWEINILKPFEIPGPSTSEAAERVVFKADLVLEQRLQSGPPR